MHLRLEYFNVMLGCGSHWTTQVSDAWIIVKFNVPGMNGLWMVGSGLVRGEYGGGGG